MHERQSVADLVEDVHQFFFVEKALLLPILVHDVVQRTTVAVLHLNEESTVRFDPGRVVTNEMLVRDEHGVGADFTPGELLVARAEDGLFRGFDRVVEPVETVGAQVNVGELPVAQEGLVTEFLFEPRNDQLA